MDVEKIPRELKPDPHFVLWREETRNGKLTKIPVNAHTGKNAAVDRPNTWATFAVAVAALTRNGTGLKGMGFVLTKSCPYTVIDLDHCRDFETGIIEP
jgi:putative DNA primase/helicase